MVNSMGLQFAGLLLLGMSLACGDEIAIVAEVDLSAFSVPMELDLVYLEMSDGTVALIGHDFPLEAGQQTAVIQLLPGKRTPDAFDLAAYGYLDSRQVATSAPQRASFADGKSRRLRFSLQPLP